MANAHPTFVRLAKGPRDNALWLATDHLLWVTSEGFLLRWSERYARFYLRDLEALFAAPSADWTAVSITLGLAGVAALVVVGLTWSDSSTDLIWLGVATFPLLWLAVRLSRGRGVVLYLQTAAGTVATSSLPRPQARRLLAHLAPLIEAAQTDLPPLDLERTRAPAIPPVRQTPPPPPLR